MKIIVQKFGGTSVATEKSRKNVYAKIKNAVSKGYKTVVVVSAMGRRGAPYATDTLLDLLRLTYPKTEKRELDQIFSCGEIISGTFITANLQKQGYKAKHLTGGQAGIITNDTYTDAIIQKIDTSKIMELLKDNYIVVVSGAQGQTKDGEITTLGRGGSDITACALASELNAEELEIYTDVDGIMTCDPLVIEKNTKTIDKISYECCYELSYQGAKVMHARSIEEAAKNKKVKLYVKSIFSNNKGTLIHAKPDEKYMPLAVTILKHLYIIKLPENINNKLINKISSDCKNKNIEGYDFIYKNNFKFMACKRSDIKEIKHILKSLNIGIISTKKVSEASIIGNNIGENKELYKKITDIMNEENIKIFLDITKDKYLGFFVGEFHINKAAKILHSLIE